MIAFLAWAGLLAGAASAAFAEQGRGGVARAGTAEPLESLKQRSALERWRESSQRWRRDVGRADERDPFHSASSSQPQSIRPIPEELPEGLPPLPTGERDVTEPIRDPRQLKRVTSILPYFDYEPDEDVLRRDPCMNLCPRPGPDVCPWPEDVAMLPDCPEELTLGDEIYEPRMVPASVFAWEPSNFWHFPLYFEDPALERYGHTHHHLVQPAVSAGRFGVQLLGLPYQMTLDPICKRVYALGWYRPGEPAPKLLYQVPWNTRAALNQAAVVTGFIFLFP